VEEIIEAGEQAIERAVGSKQPRFKGNADSIFGALVRWVKLSQELQVPDYMADSRRRDTWLQSFWMREPHWAGVVGQLTLINAGRGWTLTGGRNQVRKFTTILHEAENGAGWRQYIKQQVQSYYTTDLNAVTEVGRAGRNGPLRAVYHTDTARCKLTGNPKAPLRYYPPTGRYQEWGANDFFRMAANPYSNESFNGLGFCATSMAFEMVKLLYSVWMHDQEKAGARMPQGLLLLEGIGQEQWTEAIEARKVDLDAEQRRYFGGLYVFFSEGQEQLNHRLIGLSELPANFDRKTFIDQCMYAYALVLGMDPSEFWPVQFGSMGRGTETQVQHEKALTKGASEFALTYQEQLQRELPDSLLFEFAQRDAQGELLDAQVDQAWADVAATLMGSQTQGVPMVDTHWIPSFLVQKGVWPEEWTVEAEESVATDTEEARSRVEVRRAAELFPDEPIVRYHWPSGKEIVLWERGDLVQRKLWVKRQDDSPVLYQGDGWAITEHDVDVANEQAGRIDPEYRELLEAPLLEE
jgi:hypothetical protein